MRVFVGKQRKAVGLWLLPARPLHLQLRPLPQPGTGVLPLRRREGPARAAGREGGSILSQREEIRRGFQEGHQGGAWGAIREGGREDTQRQLSKRQVSAGVILTLPTSATTAKQLNSKSSSSNSNTSGNNSNYSSSSNNICSNCSNMNICCQSNSNCSGGGKKKTTKIAAARFHQKQDNIPFEL